MYPAPPPLSYTPPPPKQSRTMMWVGIVLCVLSVGSCATGVITAGTLVVSAASDAKPVNLGTPATVTLKKGDIGTILGYADTHDDAEAINPTVVDPNGASVKIKAFGTDTSSNGSRVDGRAIAPIGIFEADTAGVYTATGRAPTGTEGAAIAVIQLDPSDIGVRLIGGIGIGFVMMVVGVILIVVSVTKNRRARRV